MAMHHPTVSRSATPCDVVIYCILRSAVVGEAESSRAMYFVVVSGAKPRTFEESIQGGAKMSGIYIYD